MQQQLTTTVEIILSSIQFAVYLTISCFIGFKILFLSTNNKLIIYFYAFISTVTLIQMAMQLVQLIFFTEGQILSMDIIVVVNIYSITFEAWAIFILADYWKDTELILRNQSTEEEIKESRNSTVLIVQIVWLLIYSGFVAYFFISQKNNATNLNLNEVLADVMYFLFQGIAVILILCAIIDQIVSGNKLMNAIGAYEKRLNDLDMKKTHFRCLYWVTTIINLIRIAFLIVITIIIQTQQEYNDGWLAAYLYTFTNVFVLVIYAFGFTVNKGQDKSKQKQKLIDPQISDMRSGRERQSSRGSRHETELSSSYQEKKVEE